MLTFPLYRRLPIRHRYRTYEFDDSDIHVRTLRDRRQFDDPDDEAALLGISSAMWPLFGIVWDSGEALARLMWARNFHGERILEIGCGVGLASLALAMRAQDISATDQHPEAGNFLRYNVNLNELSPIPFERCSWEQPQSSLGKFDLIIGSDLLYDSASTAPLSHFIEQHSNEVCEVLIVDPNRGLRGQFSKSMTSQGFVALPRLAMTTPGRDGYKGAVLGYQRAPSTVPC